MYVVHIFCVAFVWLKRFLFRFKRLLALVVRILLGAQQRHLRHWWHLQLICRRRFHHREVPTIVTSQNVASSILWPKLKTKSKIAPMSIIKNIIYRLCCEHRQSNELNLPCGCKHRAMGKCRDKPFRYLCRWSLEPTCWRLPSSQSWSHHEWWCRTSSCG